MKDIDLNCDLGEVLLSSGRNYDDALMPYLTSCNVATGAHAGDDETIKYVIGLAQSHQVEIGAHPAYPDKENFGRVSLDIALDKLGDSLRSQISNFMSLANSLDVKVHHIKPHGALYNDMVHDREKSELVISIVKEIDPSLQLYGLANSNIADLAQQEGIQFIHEVFGDRAYDTRTALRNRKLEGSILHEIDQIEEHISVMVHKDSIRLYNGEEKPSQAQTICVHSDTENSSRILAFISSYLKDNRIDVRPT